MTWRDEGLFFLAACLTTTLACLPASAALPWAGDPQTWWVSACFGGVWAVAALRSMTRAQRRARRWRKSPAWSFDSRDLAVEESGTRLPKWLARRVNWKDRGIFLGRGFQWAPKHTQALETFLDAGDAPLPVGEDMRGGNPAIHAVGAAEERPVVLPFSELVGHGLIGGTTRSGKTRFLELVVSEVIRMPGAVVVIDPKGDADLLVRSAVEARRAGRGFGFFSPAYPEASSTFNPLGTSRTTTELAARIQALMPGGGGMSRDPFFTEYPLAIVERLAAAQEAVGDEWSIEGLNAVTNFVPPLENLIRRYLHQTVFGRGGRPAELQGLMEEYAQSGRRDLLADALIDDYSKPRDHFQKVTANLTPAFRGVVGGKIGRLLSTLPADLTWEKAVKEDMVVYFAMSSLMFGEVSNRIGRVILQDLIGFLGRRYAYDDPRAMRPITILVDEFSNIAYPGFIDALNKGGGARAHFFLAMQSLADPESAMGKDGAQRVLDNLNTRVWFRLTDDKTAETATMGLGTTTVFVPDVAEGLSYGGIGGLVGNVSQRMTRQERALLRPQVLTAMPRGECLVRTKGENWKLRVPLLHPVDEDEVRETAAHYGIAGALAQLKAPEKAAAGAGEEAGAGAAGGAERTARREAVPAPAGGGVTDGGAAVSPAAPAIGVDGAGHEGDDGIIQVDDVGYERDGGIVQVDDAGYEDAGSRAPETAASGVPGGGGNGEPAGDTAGGPGDGAGTESERDVGSGEEIFDLWDDGDGYDDEDDAEGGGWNGGQD